ncbi:uncharacterized protein LOC122460798 [Dermochelys coriacea]|uniref:uncharacterized protein LOC122460798 n=1 Tax=Dermochelys coriacea TaxID=27794 RepID=UPI001CA82B44|nr:uncharacterized protein LOC122460798 [Dermochelys coriacea]
MSVQQSYEALCRKSLEDLCLQKGLSFKEKNPDQELKNLLMANDQEADPVRMLAIRNKQQLEFEQKRMDLCLLEKQKIAKWKKRLKKGLIKWKKVHLKHIEWLAAEKAHQMQQESARLQLQVLEEQKKLTQPATPSPLDNKNWDIEEFLSIFEHLCEIHHIPEAQRMPVLLTRLTGKAREVFNEMGMDEALNYVKYKYTVLKHFKVTSETYRLKFRNFKMSNVFSYVECAHKLLDFVSK